MAHSELRRAVSETKLKTRKLWESNKWQILNKELVLDKTALARKLVVELKEENLRITRQLDHLDAVLYRIYNRNTHQFNEQK